MARVFSLAVDEFEIPSIHHLELEWAGAAHEQLARQIGFQDQFRRLYRHIFLQLQSVPADRRNLPPMPLSLSVRAGAIKAYVLLTVSIAEGALAALGDERGLGARPGELYQRTFGQLLSAWVENSVPRPEVAEIWDHLQLLNRYRNYVHLNRAVQQQVTWQDVIQNEQVILDAAERVVAHLKELCHIFRDDP